MKLSAFLSVLLISLPVVVWTGCSESNPTRPGKATSSNPTSYRLKKQMSGSETSGQSYSYSYNEQNLVSKIQRIQWGMVYVSGKPPEQWTDTTSHELYYENGRPVKRVSWEGGEVRGNQWTFIYDYIGTHVTKESVYYANGAMQEYRTYQYDDNGNMVRTETYRDSILSFGTSFEYDQDGNVISELRYSYRENPVKRSQYNYSTFDKGVGVNVLKSINGLPVLFQAFLHGDCLTCPNNVVNKDYYSQVDEGQPLPAPSHRTYTYQYNDEGLPVQIHNGNTTITLEYEKYR